MTNDKPLVPKLRFPGFTDPWQQRKLGDVAKIVSGGTPSTQRSEYWNGDIDWYSPVEINNQIYVSGSQSKITNLGLQKSSAKILPVGTVLFTSRAGIGKTAILAKEGTTNQGFQSIIPYENELDSYFIFSKSDELKRYGQTNGAGSTFVEVSGKQMAKMRIMLPKIKEQIKIGSFFKQLDDLIALHRRKLSHLEELKKGLLQKMFPKSGETYPELRFPGFTDPWQQRKLGDVAEFQNGRAYKQNELLTSGKYPVLRVGNFNTNDKWYYSDLELPAKNYADKGDLLYTWATAFGPHIWTGSKVIYHYHIWKVEPTTELSKDFMVHLFAADQAQMTNRLNGSTMVHITKVTMESKVVSIPSVTEQKFITNLLNGFDTAIALHRRKLSHLDQQKKALLQQMFV